MSAGPSLAPLAPARLEDALAGARGVVFLVGGYDGAGNFGDIVQLEEAARLVARLGDGVVAVPVIDGDNVANSRAIEFNPLPNCDPHRPLVVGAAAGEDGLAPAVLPASVVWTSTYLFGGGYFNGAWAESRLAAVRALDALALRSGLDLPALVSSGIQIDSEWLQGLDGPDLDLVNRLSTLGVRDLPRPDAVPGGLAADVVETADDTVGAFAGLGRGPELEAVGDGPVLNLQLAQHPWMYDDPRAPIEYLVRFVDELAIAHGRSTTPVRPLVAFEDSRTSERAAYEEFVEHPLEGRRPLLAARRLALSSVGLSAQAQTVRQARLTVCSSYHTALFSLMAGVPAAIVVESGHYADKATALRRAFGLPAEFVLELDGDPRAAARGIVALLDGEARSELAAGLARGRERLIALRARAEAELVGELAGGFAAALAAYADSLAAAAGGDPQSANRLAALRGDLAAALAEGAAARAQAGRALHAQRELAARLESERAESERLREVVATMAGSRSWRLTAPLRARRSALRDGIRAALRRSDDDAAG